MCTVGIAGMVVVVMKTGGDDGSDTSLLRWCFPGENSGDGVPPPGGLTRYSFYAARNDSKRSTVQCSGCSVYTQYISPV